MYVVKRFLDFHWSICLFYYLNPLFFSLSVYCICIAAVWGYFMLIVLKKVIALCFLIRKNNMWENHTFICFSRSKCSQIKLFSLLSASSWYLSAHEAHPPPKETGQCSIFCQLSFYTNIIRRPPEEQVMFGVFSTVGIWGKVQAVLLNWCYISFGLSSLFSLHSAISNNYKTFSAYKTAIYV